MKASNPTKAGRIHGAVKTAVICAVLTPLFIYAPFIGRAGAASEAEQIVRVELAQGMIGADEWRSEVQSPEEAQERKEGHLCLAVQYLAVWPKEMRSEGSEGAQCQALEAHEVMFEYFSVHRKGGKPHSAVAFLMDGSASQIALKLKGHPVETIRLQHLPPQEVTYGRRMAYFSRGYARPFCLQRLVAYDAAGLRVAHLPGQGCL